MTAPPPPPNPPLFALTPQDPRSFPPFRIHGRLGSGGMGVVYGATDPNGMWVAIKVIRAEYASDPDFRSRFAREVDLMRRVRARCIVPVLAFDTEAPQPWYATPYIPGPTLGRRIRDHGPLPEDQARVVGAGMAEAIAAIHAAGIVHRDLKPGNVILAPDGPKVLDFGIARTADDTTLTAAGGIVGSPRWMSPERLRGHTGPEADIFAWGSLVAYASTGRPPFGTGEVETLIYRVLHEEPDLAGVPQGLVDPVARALAKDPTQRPTATSLLRDIAAPAQAPGMDDANLVGALITRHWQPPAPPPSTPDPQPGQPPGVFHAAGSGPPPDASLPSHTPSQPSVTPSEPTQPPRRRAGLLLGVGAGALTVVLLAALGAWALTRDENGGGAAPSSPAPEEEPEALPPADLVIETYGDRGHTELIERFMLEYPNISVEERHFDNFEQWNERLRTSLASGAELGDVVVIDETILPEMGGYGGNFHDLHDLGVGEMEDHFLRWNWEQGHTPEGQLLGLGADIGGMALCYRPDLLEEAGLPSDRDELSERWQSWDDFVESGTEFRDSGVDAAFVDTVTGFVTVASRQSGGHIYVDGDDELVMADSAAVEEGWELAGELIEEDLTAGLSMWQPAWFDGLESGAFAVVPCPSWMLDQIEESSGDDGDGAWDVTTAPGGGNWGGTWLAVPRSSEYPEQAAELVMFLTSAEGHLESWEEAGLLPASPEALQSAEVQDHTRPYFRDAPVGRIYAESVLDLEPFHYGPSHFRVESAVGEVLNEWENGDIGADDAWDRALAAADEASG